MAFAELDYERSAKLLSDIGQYTSRAGLDALSRSREEPQRWQIFGESIQVSIELKRGLDRR